MTPRSLELIAVPDIPLFVGGEDVGQVIYEKCLAHGITLRLQDVVVIAQKLVSKAERRIFKLDNFVPSPEAIELAERCGRDPRLCQAYLSESDAVVEIGRQTQHGRMVLMRHKIGFVITAAGVDRSNLDPSHGAQVVLLPVDSDKSAARIRARLTELSGHDVAVIVNDSFGRTDRRGSVGQAIGFSGMRHLETGSTKDLYGQPITPEISIVDEVSAAASVLMGQGSEAYPVVIARGVPYTASDESGIRDLLL